MARKKSARKKKSIAKKKPALKKKSAARKKATARKKAVARKKPARRSAAKKKAARKKTARATSGRRRTRREITSAIPIESRRGLGARSGGQSGDTQGLSRGEYTDSESVEELLEEGQYMEAEAVSGVENARDPDQGEVRTREVPEDDVPEEYENQD
jgi:hypothetical protein